MDAARDPEYLKATAQAVTDFKTALEELLSLHETNHVARGLAPAVVPHDDADPEEVHYARAKAARAAGRACYATRLTGSYIHVEGHGAVDPIAAWHSMASPKPLLEPDNVLEMCDQILGRLEAMAAKAAAEAPSVTGVELLHPLVWGAARRLWLDEHYREAVASAAEALVTHVQARTGRRDLPATSLWQQVFSASDPKEGQPRLRWPGDPQDQTVRSMNDGLRQFAPGAQMTIRNTSAHGTDGMTAQDALERLAALSLLARWADGCDDVTAQAADSS
jgi:uncharacterized protein (TIGR02391 family)